MTQLRTMAVHGDVLTDPSTVQTMVDNLTVADKQLLWICGSVARWDGSLAFQRCPEPMQEWCEQHRS